MHKQGDEQIRALRAQFHNFSESVDDMNFTPPYLAKIKARTLIVHGDRDPFLPLAIPMELRRAIPHSYLWIMPNVGVTPIFEQPAQFYQTSLDFLRADTK